MKRQSGVPYNPNSNLTLYANCIYKKNCTRKKCSWNEAFPRGLSPWEAGGLGGRWWHHCWGLRWRNTWHIWQVIGITSNWSFNNYFQIDLDEVQPVGGGGLPGQQREAEGKAGRQRGLEMSLLGRRRQTWPGWHCSPQHPSSWEMGLQERRNGLTWDLWLVCNVLEREDIDVM